MLTTVRRLSSNLMSGRFCGRTEAPNHCENRLILENYFSDQIKQKFGFSDKESKRATLLCSKAFEDNLSSREEIRRVVDFVYKHFCSQDVSHNPQIFLLNRRASCGMLSLSLSFAGMTCTSVGAAYEPAPILFFCPKRRSSAARNLRGAPIPPVSSAKIARRKTPRNRHPRSRAAAP